MYIKQALQQWNKQKWESRNRAMYERFEETGGPGVTKVSIPTSKS